MKMLDGERGVEWVLGLDLTALELLLDFFAELEALGNVFISSFHGKRRVLPDTSHLRRVSGQVLEQRKSLLHRHLPGNPVAPKSIRKETLNKESVHYFIRNSQMDPVPQCLSSSLGSLSAACL